MSEYSEGKKAWMDQGMTWEEADKKSRLFRAGYNNAAKLYPNRRPKITVRSQAEIAKDLSMIKCDHCDAKFDIDDLLHDEEFLTNRECLECKSKIPIKFGDL